MEQVNITPQGPADRERAGDIWAPVAHNLSVALAAVMVIAAVAIVLVYVVQAIHV